MFCTRLAFAATLLGVLGCTVVRPVSQPSEFIPEESPDVVVVVYKDQSQVPVSDPRLSGDTLHGTWMGLGEPIAVPLSDVDRIEARQRDGKRTGLLVAGSIAATAAGIWAFTLLTGDSDACDYTYQPGTVPEGRCIGDGPPPMN